MINERLSLGWYVSADGACWTHLLLWIAKDLAWLQCWLWASTSIAAVGCCLSLFMIFRNIRAGEFVCAVSEAGVLVWLYGNAEWMYGECHDFTYHVTDPDSALDDKTTAESALVLWAAGAIFAVLCIIRLCRRRLCCWHQRALRLDFGDENDGNDLRPHGWMLCIFREWADYEEFHNLTWLCCDLSWNLLSAGFWWPAAAFTLFIACDTAAVSSRVRGGAVDTAHYVFQLIWVVSNCIWVYGDLYTDQDNQDPEIIVSLLSPTADALSNFRFLSSIVCLLALFMAIVFHLYWAWTTLSRAAFVPSRIQFLLSLEDDGMSLQTSAPSHLSICVPHADPFSFRYRRFDNLSGFPTMQYDRLSPPAAGRRESVDGSINFVEDRDGGALDPSHSPTHHDAMSCDSDTQSLLGGRKKATWGDFVTPPPLPSAVKCGAAALRREDGV